MAKVNTLEVSVAVLLAQPATEETHAVRKAEFDALAALSTVPPLKTSPGVAGAHAASTMFEYRAIATNTWVRKPVIKNWDAALVPAAGKLLLNVGVAADEWGERLLTPTANSLLAFDGSGVPVILAQSTFATAAALTSGLSTLTSGLVALTATVATKEPGLGNPAANGYVLSSTTGGTRSWIPVSSGAGVEDWTHFAVLSQDGDDGTGELGTGKAYATAAAALADGATGLMLLPRASGDYGAATITGATTIMGMGYELNCRLGAVTIDAGGSLTGNGMELVGVSSALGAGNPVALKGIAIAAVNGSGVNGTSGSVGGNAGEITLEACRILGSIIQVGGTGGSGIGSAGSAATVQLDWSAWDGNTNGYFSLDGNAVTFGGLSEPSGTPPALSMPSGWSYSVPTFNLLVITQDAVGSGHSFDDIGLAGTGVTVSSPFSDGTNDVSGDGYTGGNDAALTVRDCKMEGTLTRGAGVGGSGVYGGADGASGESVGGPALVERTSMPASNTFDLPQAAVCLLCNTPTAPVDTTLTFQSYNASTTTLGNSTTGTGSAIVLSDSPVFGGAPLVPTASIGTNTTQVASCAFVMTATQTATAGLNPKVAARVATTANITLSGAQTIDGISVVAGDRVLVKNQSTASQNGLYLCASGAWTRTTDMDAWAEVPSAFLFVQVGTANADTGWLCVSDAGGTLGSTAITWTQYAGIGTFQPLNTTLTNLNGKTLSGSGDIVLGTGATISGATISGGTAQALTTFGIRSSGAAFDLRIASSEVLTANRTLTVVMGDAARTLTLSGNPSLSGITITGTGTIASTTGKTLTFSNSITLAGTDGTIMTFPATSATVARSDAANTFTGNQTFNGTNNTAPNQTGQAPSSDTLMNRSQGDARYLEWDRTKTITAAFTSGGNGKLAVFVFRKEVNDFTHDGLTFRRFKQECAVGPYSSTADQSVTVAQIPFNPGMISWMTEDGYSATTQFGLIQVGNGAPSPPGNSVAPYGPNNGYNSTRWRFKFGASITANAGDEITLCDAAGTGGSQFKFIVDKTVIDATTFGADLDNGVHVRKITAGTNDPSTGTDTHVKVNGGSPVAAAYVSNSATNTADMPYTVLFPSTNGANVDINYFGRPWRMNWLTILAHS